MPPNTAGWDELHLAEDPAVELLEFLGYAYVAPETLEGERASFRETILTDRLAAAVERLNSWLSVTNVAAAVKAVTQVPAASLAEANRKNYTSLTYSIALEQDRGDGRKSHTVRFLDFDHPDRNEWIVTRQYRVLGSKKHVIPDVVVFVNGLPLAVVECKSPTIGDAWRAEAVKQLRRYQEADTTWTGQGAPKLFEAAQILVGTCGDGPDAAREAVRNARASRRHPGIDLRVPWSPTQQAVRPAPAGNRPGTDRNWQVVASWPCSGPSRIWRRHGWGAAEAQERLTRTRRRNATKAPIASPAGGGRQHRRRDRATQ